MAAADDASSMEGVRHRRAPADRSGRQETLSERGDASEKEKPIMTDSCKLQKGTYWLTRIVLLRYISFIYCRCSVVNSKWCSQKNPWHLCILHEACFQRRFGHDENCTCACVRACEYVCDINVMVSLFAAIRSSTGTYCKHFHIFTDNKRSQISCSGDDGGCSILDSV